MAPAPAPSGDDAASGASSAFFSFTSSASPKPGAGSRTHLPRRGHSPQSIESKINFVADLGGAHAAAAPLMMAAMQQHAPPQVRAAAALPLPASPPRNAPAASTAVPLAEDPKAHLPTPRFLADAFDTVQVQQQVPDIPAPSTFTFTFTVHTTPGRSSSHRSKSQRTSTQPAAPDASAPAPATAAAPSATPPLFMPSTTRATAAPASVTVDVSKPQPPAPQPPQYGRRSDPSASPSAAPPRRQQGTPAATTATRRSSRISAAPAAATTAAPPTQQPPPIAPTEPTTTSFAFGSASVFGAAPVSGATSSFGTRAAGAAPELPSSSPSFLQQQPQPARGFTEKPSLTAAPLPTFNAAFVPGTPGGSAVKRSAARRRTPAAARTARPSATPTSSAVPWPTQQHAQSPFSPSLFGQPAAGTAAGAAASPFPASFTGGFGPAATATFVAAHPAPSCQQAASGAQAAQVHPSPSFNPNPNPNSSPGAAMSWSPPDTGASKGSSVGMPFWSTNPSPWPQTGGKTSAQGTTTQGASASGSRPTARRAVEDLSEDLEHLDILRDSVGGMQNGAPKAAAGAAAPAGGGKGIGTGGSFGSQGRGGAGSSLYPNPKSAASSSDLADDRQQQKDVGSRPSQQQQQQQHAIWPSAAAAQSAAAEAPFSGFGREPTPTPSPPGAFSGAGWPGFSAAAASGSASFWTGPTPGSSATAAGIQPAAAAATGTNSAAVPSPFTFNLAGSAQPPPPSASSSQQQEPSPSFTFSFGGKTEGPTPSSSEQQPASSGPIFSASPSTDGAAARRSASRLIKKSPNATGRHKSASGTAHHAPPPPSAAASTSSGSYNAGGLSRSAQPASAAQPSSSSFRSHHRSAEQVAQATELALSHKESGNISFQAAKYMQAEVSYSHAIMALESINENGIDLAVLHSNRAGARLMIGKPLTALQDARRAVQLDPKFIRAVVRVATCHLRMGDFSAALSVAGSLLDKLSPLSQHFQDVTKKMREVEEVQRQLGALRAQLCGPSDLSMEKLQELNQAMEQLQPQVLYSDEMAAMRVRGLVQSGLLPETLRCLEVSYEGKGLLRHAPWRLWVDVQLKYHQGDLTAALASCEALLKVLRSSSSAPSDPSTSSNSCSDPNFELSKLSPAEQQSGVGAEELARSFARPMVAAVVGWPDAEGVERCMERMGRLAQLKEQGNAAVKSKQLKEAVERYSEALALGSSAQYAAVLHSNRAAAHQGLGNLMEALADCGRSKALDPSFVRAQTRMAALLQEVRRLEDADRLLSSLAGTASTSRSQQQDQQQQPAAKLTAQERATVQDQHREVRSCLKYQKTADHYKVLQLERSCSDEEVRRAYRKAALKYHPDKALSSCRVCVELPASSSSSSASEATAAANGGGPSGGPLWLLRQGGKAAGELEARVREEATMLFNMINQANEQLSDKALRRKVDQLLEVESFAPHSHPSSSMHYASGMYGGGGFKAYGAGPTGGAGGFGASGYSSRGAGSGTDSFGRRPGSTYGTSGYASGSNAYGPSAGQHSTSSSYSRYFNQNASGTQRTGSTRPQAGSYRSAYTGAQPRWYDQAAGPGDSAAGEYDHY